MLDLLAREHDRVACSTWYDLHSVQQAQQIASTGAKKRSSWLVVRGASQLVLAANQKNTSEGRDMKVLYTYE